MLIIMNTMHTQSSLLVLKSFTLKYVLLKAVKHVIFSSLEILFLKINQANVLCKDW
jgi:hypothetical protein